MTQVTLRSLCLIAVSVIASFEPRAIFRPQHLLCTSGVLDAVVVAFVEETKALDTRIKRYSNGLDLLPDDGSVSITLIDTCLRIFEATTAGSLEAAPRLSNHIATLAPALANVLLTAYLLTTASPSARSSQAAIDCLLSTLKMLLELTTHRPEWAEALGRDGALVRTLLRLLLATRTESAKAGKGRFTLPADTDHVESEDGGGQRDYNFDVLCLGLGVLANLVEAGGEIRRVIRETRK